VGPGGRRQRSGGLRFKASLGKWFARPYLENTQYKKGLVEWLKVWALSSSSNITKINK
jgi:hypothetical protein